MNNKQIARVIRLLQTYACHEDYCEVDRTEFCTCGLRPLSLQVRLMLRELEV